MHSHSGIGIGMHYVSLVPSIKVFGFCGFSIKKRRNCAKPQMKG